jgi:hypothetical protein
LILVPRRCLKRFIPGFRFLAFTFLAFSFLVKALLVGALLVGALLVGALLVEALLVKALLVGVTRQPSAATRPPTVAPPINYGWRQWRVVAGWVI